MTDRYYRELGGSVKQQAKTFRLTFPDQKPIIVIGLGNHECIRFELTFDQLRGLVLDAVPELLKR